MRTTLTLDDDVAVKLKAAAKNRPFRDVVNEVLRAGFKALDKRTATRRPYQTRGLDLGQSLVGSLDNIEEVLSRAEGDQHR
jgi:hypothetical protein